jgi:hypothetical protein
VESSRPGVRGQSKFLVSLILKCFIFSEITLRDDNTRNNKIVTLSDYYVLNTIMSSLYKPLSQPSMVGTVIIVTLR